MRDSVVFLDIDGVLNQLQGNYRIDDRCVEILKNICYGMKADIVLTSSWRAGWSSQEKYYTEQIKNLIRKLSPVKICGKTVKLGDRAIEVNMFLEKYSDIKRYVILDDDKSEFRSNVKGLYIVNHRTGLTMADKRRVLETVIERK